MASQPRGAPWNEVVPSFWHVLCDKRVPQKLKGRFYRTAIQPAMSYGVECWGKQHVQQLGVAEMHMFGMDTCPTQGSALEWGYTWPPETRVHRGQLRHADNVKKGQGRPNLAWEESVKRDLKGLEYHQSSHGQGCTEASYPRARTIS